MGDADEVDIGGDDVENNLSKNEVLTSKKNDFPLAVPTRQKFPNQDYELYEKGYDSDGCLITFDEYAKRGENPDDFVEEAIAELSVEDGNASQLAASRAPSALPPPPAPSLSSNNNLTCKKIISMTSIQWKAELEKRGKPKSAKNKSILQQHLIDAIDASISAAPALQHKSMMGLDVTSKWVLLTPNPTPIPNPSNPDNSLWPPTERDGALNPKYGYNETFQQQEFEGTTKKMKCTTQKKKRKSLLAERESERILSHQRAMQGITK